MRSHNETLFNKVSKILDEFNKVFNFENFLIYVQPKFNWNLICICCYLYFLILNLTQNFYNCKFYNVKNEFNVTNVCSYKFLKHLSINWFLQPAIGLSLLSAQIVSSVKNNS